MKKKRNIAKLLSLQGVIDLRTKSASLKKKKFSRKQKHKDQYA